MKDKYPVRMTLESVEVVNKRLSDQDDEIQRLRALLGETVKERDEEHRNAIRILHESRAWMQKFAFADDDRQRLARELAQAQTDQAATAKRAARLQHLITNLVAIGQRQPDAIILTALGFDMHNTKWRFGFNGWERQAEEQQAGCFPAIDWIDEMLALSPAPDDPAETERLVAIGMDVVRQVLAGTWKAPDEEE